MENNYPGNMNKINDILGLHSGNFIKVSCQVHGIDLQAINRLPKGLYGTFMCTQWPFVGPLRFVRLISSYKSS